jgi:hypothetical protein
VIGFRKICRKVTPNPLSVPVDREVTAPPPESR